MLRPCQPRATQSTACCDHHRSRAGVAIRRPLNLSTAHLPRHLGTPGGLDAIPGVVAYPTEGGFLLQVPDDPDEPAQATIDPVPSVVLANQRYARAGVAAPAQRHHGFTRAEASAWTLSGPAPV